MRSFSDSDIIQLVDDHYGISVSGVKQLDGYIDLNYKLSANGGFQYILKLSTSDPLYSLEAQNKMLEHLSDQSDRYPKVIPTRSFNFVITEGDYHVRLLEFLEGEFLADVDYNREGLLHNFGKGVAQMDTSLMSLELPTLSHLVRDWDLSHTSLQRQNLKFVERVEQKRLIHYFLLQFEQQVLPKLPPLRKSVLHNDANPMNVLVEGNEIRGFIDFGDSVFGPMIFDPVIAMTYIMMEHDDPIARGVYFLEGYHKELNLLEEELSLFYYLVAARLCTSQLMSAKSRAENPDNSYANIDEDRAYDLLKKLLSINPKKFENELRRACGFSDALKIENHKLMEIRSECISKSQSISYDKPIHMQSAAMQYMYAADGKAYVDCVNNIMHVGHCHPSVVEAGQKQLAKMNTNTRYLYNSLNEYAERLLDKLPNNLTKIFFINSGSAASDLAIRLAKTYTQKSDIIVIEQGYHGNTEVGIDISSYKFDGKGGKGSSKHIHKISMPDTYRDSRSGVEFAKEVDPIIASQEIAAFIAEPILSCGGQLMLPDHYFKTIYQKVRSTGGVCIADETQVGFGRVGKHFWGFELQEVEPDIVIMGKPIGNGHPMAAVACTDKVAKGFENGMEFFSSFGGNPVSCEIGLAVLNVIEEEGLQQHALDLGNYILNQWHDLKDSFDCVGDVRGVGLFLGIEFVKSRSSKEPDAEIAHAIVQQMKSKGFLLSTDGPYHNVIKFKPPMVFDKTNADSLFISLKEVISNLR